jgi:hypothetical protein
MYHDFGDDLVVGALEHEFYDFPYIGNGIIPTDELIFFRGVGIPPISLLLGLPHQFNGNFRILK